MLSARPSQVRTSPFEGISPQLTSYAGRVEGIRDSSSALALSPLWVESRPKRLTAGMGGKRTKRGGSGVVFAPLHDVRNRPRADAPATPEPSRWLGSSGR